jgi:Fe-S-cluster-containing dehydrogenase component
VGRAPACVEACKVGALSYGEWQETQEDKGRALAQAVFASLQAPKETEPSLPGCIRAWRQLS